MQKKRNKMRAAQLVLLIILAGFSISWISVRAILEYYGQTAGWQNYRVHQPEKKQINPADYKSPVTNSPFWQGEGAKTWRR